MRIKRKILKTRLYVAEMAGDIMAFNTAKERKEWLEMSMIAETDPVTLAIYRLEKKNA